MTRWWHCCVVLAVALFVASEAHARWTYWSTPPEYRRTRIPTPTRTRTSAVSTATRTPTRTSTPTATWTPVPVQTAGSTPTLGSGSCYYAIRDCLDTPEYPPPPPYPTPGATRKWVTPDTVWLREMPAVECPQQPGLRCCIDAYPPWWDGTTWRKAKATMSSQCFRHYVILQPSTCTLADGLTWQPGQTMWGHELQHILSDEWRQYGRPEATHETNWRPECEVPADYEGPRYYP